MRFYLNSESTVTVREFASPDYLPQHTQTRVSISTTLILTGVSLSLTLVAAT